MKKITFKYTAIALALASAATLSSCSDFLDKQASNELTGDQTFGSWETLLEFHQDTYNFLLHGANRVNSSWLDAATDLSETAMSTGGTRTSFNIGNYYAGGGAAELDGLMESRYRGIRKTNQVLERIQEVPQPITLDAEQFAREKTNMIAEARFFRAYFYWEMFLRFGPLPIIKEVLDPEKDMITPYKDRPSVREYIDFVLSELDACKDDLLTHEEGTKTTVSGRLIQPMAYGMIARIKLYMASPRFASESGITWQDAADANQEFIDKFGANYRLFSTSADVTVPAVVDPETGEILEPEHTEPGYADNYSNAVLQTQYSGNNTEVIFFRNDAVANWGSIINDVPVGEGGNGGNCPSQNLVDMYDMIDGSSPFQNYDATGAPVYDSNGNPTINAASGYSDARMWQNRDKRLEATVLYQGQQWGTTRADSRINVISGMADNPLGNANATPTGYYMRKYIPATILSSNHGGTAYRLWTIQRYAEILLNLAEALNEVGGPTTQVADLLDQVRHRAGIRGNVADRTDLMGSKEAMRNFIHKERTVEFAFEEHRPWDVRRWNVAVQALSRPIYGVEITRASGAADDYTPGNYNIRRKKAQDRVFEERMYLYPIPESEYWKTGLENNPGW